MIISNNNFQFLFVAAKTIPEVAGGFEGGQNLRGGEGGRTGVFSLTLVMSHWVVLYTTLTLALSSALFTPAVCDVLLRYCTSQ